MSEGRQFATEAEALEFILSGKATFTVVSKRTEKRFTFKVVRPRRVAKAEDNGQRYVYLMTGQDNETSYTYIGSVNRGFFKMKESEYGQGTAAFGWILKALKTNKPVMDQAEIWHEGRCGACGKKLTVPESIASGYGPECVKTRYVCE